MPQVLFRCDQCTYEEWRDASETVTLCPVCGYMRWEAVAMEEPDDGSPEGAPGSGGDPE